MGRLKKEEVVQKTAEVEENNTVKEIAPEVEEKIEIDEESNEAELMRLYPQYKKLWISSRGFVYPEGTPEYLLKDAKLYTNVYSK